MPSFEEFNFAPDSGGILCIGRNIDILSSSLSSTGSALSIFVWILFAWVSAVCAPKASLSSRGWLGSASLSIISDDSKLGLCLPFMGPCILWLTGGREVVVLIDLAVFLLSYFVVGFALSSWVNGGAPFGFDFVGYIGFMFLCAGEESMVESFGLFFISG